MVKRLREKAEALPLLPANADSVVKFFDAGCGQGHACFYAALLWRVNAAGIEHPDNFVAAKHTLDALNNLVGEPVSKRVRLSEKDITAPGFSLAGVTHATCIIDSAPLVQRFLEVAARCASVRAVAFVAGLGMGNMDLGPFTADASALSVSVDGGRNKRTVQVARRLAGK
ncbi:hypothetical protein JKP88DRAFT_313767 [Tribonema minus]|uniref:Uncharacterized protein n=1 Tax=Tribonema minus TaxID=303371 RepID=A0A835Z3A6_9STRA|nr:hypothetical protein JKP88DRAFT_313767 [Tribonema minus]